MNIKLGILKGTAGDLEQHYQAACEELQVPYQMIDLSASDWLERIHQIECDGFLARPPHDIAEKKTLFDEKLYFINKVLQRPVYPSFEELFLYENKRIQAYWLALNGFPHPPTRVFECKEEALAYAEQAQYPLIFKSAIGSAATAVNIVRSTAKAKKIIHKVFGRFHPYLTLGYVRYKKKFGLPLPMWGKTQKHYLIAQQFLKVKWEWRIIKIGNSYFGHQKLLKNQFASGSNRVGWVRPPNELLLLAKQICETGGFYSMALDILEGEDGQYHVIELQSLFGSYDDSQMYIDGVPGRFKFIDDSFQFEEGKFNRHGSYLLRVEHFLEILKGRR